MNMTISLQTLRRYGACDKGMEWFLETYGDEAEFSREMFHEVMRKSADEIRDFCLWAIGEGLVPENILQGIDLSGITIRRLRNPGFECVDLSGANFFGATIEDTAFDAANLDGANFSFARLTDCSVSEIDCKGTDLRRMTAERCTFIGSPLDQCLLDHTRFAYCALACTGLPEDKKHLMVKKREKA